MATKITGPVKLPDGTNPAHGRVIFRLLAPIMGDVLVTPAAVVAPIVTGSINVDLEAEAQGTLYSVTVEHWSSADARLVVTSLPNVVPTGAAGPFTIEELAAVPIPSRASNEATWKRGDTISIGGRWIDVNARPLDLTGMTVSASMQGPDGILRAMAVIVTDAAKGEIELSMTAPRSATLALGRHAIDVKVTNGARVSRTQTGTIHITQEVTP